MQKETIAEIFGVAPKDADTCHAFLHCRNPATTFLKTHLGKLPVCQRCYNRLAPAKPACGQDCNCPKTPKHNHADKP